jgi:hypothetical protein
VRRVSRGRITQVNSAVNMDELIARASNWGSPANPTRVEISSSVGNAAAQVSRNCFQLGSALPDGTSNQVFEPWAVVRRSSEKGRPRVSRVCRCADFSHARRCLGESNW